jgi:hypothetical protein|nr:MAG TPA: hypothetical protein [Caudoviricetes sp.]
MVVDVLIAILLAIVIMFIGCKVVVEWCKTELRKQGFSEFDISRLKLRGELFVAYLLCKDYSYTADEVIHAIDEGYKLEDILKGIR